MTQNSFRWFVVVLAVFAFLSAPAATRADGITFAFVGGSIFAQRPIGGSNPPYITNDPAVTSAISKTAVTRVHYVTRFVGNTPPGTAVPPTLGITTYPNSFNFGRVLFMTGSLQSTSGTTSAFFNSGGYVNIIAGSAMALATGGAVPAGSMMFSGYFSDITSFIQTNAPLTLPAFITNRCGAHPTPTCINNNTTTYNSTYLPNFNYSFVLSGSVSGTVSNGVLNFFHLGQSGNANGFFLANVAGFRGPGSTAILKGSLGNGEQGTASVVVPEPASLTLLGTGLAALAGALRRRKRA